MAEICEKVGRLGSVLDRAFPVDHNPVHLSPALGTRPISTGQRSDFRTGRAVAHSSSFPAAQLAQGAQVIQTVKHSRRFRSDHVGTRFSQRGTRTWTIGAVRVRNAAAYVPPPQG